jgi:hypothetical protein
MFMTSHGELPFRRPVRRECVPGVAGRRDFADTPWRWGPEMKG